MDTFEKEEKHTDSRMVFEVWPGNNNFLFGGRLILGPDTKVLVLTVFLIGIPSAAHAYFVARKLHLVLLIFACIWPVWCLVVLLKTSTTDPGILPRKAYPPQGYRNFPRIRDVEVNGHTVKSKYCDTCNLYRPPRCSHCSVCNNCVERFDHHCPWIGQCVGKRNYRFYVLFVASTTVLCIYVFTCSALVIKEAHDELKDDEGSSTLWKAMRKQPAAIALMVYVFLCVWFVGGLCGFHSYLITSNQTTYENFRSKLDSDVNPFDEGIFRNWCTLCLPIPPSKLSLRQPIADFERQQMEELEAGHQSSSQLSFNGASLALPDPSENGGGVSSRAEPPQVGSPAPQPWNAADSSIESLAMAESPTPGSNIKGGLAGRSRGSSEGEGREGVTRERDSSTGEYVDAVGDEQPGVELQPAGQALPAGQPEPAVELPAVEPSRSRGGSSER